ncbi:MAG: hypothetical protein N2C14_03785 [Planctomycetales bacterium]
MFDPSTDHQAFDGLQDVVFQQAATGAVDAVAQALRRDVTVQEAEVSQGAYRQGDARWELPARELMIDPQPGDAIIEDDGSRWTVLAVDQTTLGSRWRCWCRNLTVAERLSQRVALQQAVWSHDAAGAATPEWVNQRIGLLVRIQPASAEVVERHAARGWKVTHEIFLAEPLELDADHRFLHEGQAYYVRGAEAMERIDRLQIVLTERTPWTQA